MKLHEKIVPYSIDKGSYGVYFGEHDRELDYLAGMAVGKVESVSLKVWCYARFQQALSLNSGARSKL